MKSMESLFLINLTLLFTIVYFSFSIFSAIKQYRSTTNEIRTSKTVSMFAEARGDLINLVNENKLDPKSKSFKFLYGMNTAFMRRPEQYLQISKELISSFGNQTNNSNPNSTNLFIEINKDSKDYEDLLNVYVKSLNAISHIAIEYSLPLRILMKFSKEKNNKLKHIDFLYSSIQGFNFLKKLAKEYEDKKKFEKYQSQIKSNLNSNIKLA